MRRVLAILLALAMCFALAACGAKEEAKPAESAAKPEGEKIRLVYEVTDLSATYFIDSYNGFKPIFDANGIEHSMVAPAGGYSAEGQLADLENCIASGKYDVILTYVGKPETCGDIVDYADQYGVKVIGYCQDAESNMGHVYYGTNTTQQGEMCAQMAIDYVDKHPELYAEFDENHKIPYAVMANFDNPQLLARNTRSKEVLDADGRFEMVYEQPCLNTEGAMKYAEDLITLHPDVKIILGASDTQALAVMEVFNTSGYEGDDSVGIFSHDCVAQTHDSIRNNGLIRGSGYAPYETIAQDIVDICKLLVSGDEIDQSKLPYIYCYGVTAENIDEFFPDEK